MDNQDGFLKAEELLDNNQILVRKSISSDIDIMVSISKDKRLSYEKAQPQFWSYSGKDGDIYCTHLSNQNFVYCST